MKSCKYLICTKGSPDWGLGHLLRVKVFVKQILGLGESIGVVALVSAGVEPVLNDLASVVSFIYEEKDFIQHVQRAKPKVLIFDMVQISDSVFSELESDLRVSISPIFSHSDKMDIIFTREVSLCALEKTPKVYGGLEFAIFNDSAEYISDEQYMRNLAQKELSIAISMGGGDAPNKSLRILKELSKLKRPCVFWLILGEGYAHSYEDLVKTIKIENRHEVILARTNRSLWRILSNCSIAILAGGLTTLEAIYAGLPSINIFEKQEHNQAMASEIWDANACIDGGSFTSENLNRLRDELERLLKKRSMLLELRENSKGLLNKFASVKIFEIIKSSTIN